MITIDISFSFYCAIVDAITNKKTLLELQIVFNEAQTTLWHFEAIGFVFPTPFYQLPVFVMLTSLIGRQKHSTFFFPDCGHWQNSYCAKEMLIAQPANASKCIESKARGNELLTNGGPAQ